MRYSILALSMLFCLVLSSVEAQAQPRVIIEFPVGRITTYPELVLVPGYPVYYAPRLRMNYFFYDGLYWVYESDGWYVSNWYAGPWDFVDPWDVPLFVLRVPIRYYRHPPAYFHGWRDDRPPHWSERWGRDWEEAHRGGWEQWDHQSASPPAPRPDYQRPYAGKRYPRAADQRRSIRSEHYHYQPREPVTRRDYNEGKPIPPRGQPQPRMQPHHTQPKH